MITDNEQKDLDIAIANDAGNDVLVDIVNCCAVGDLRWRTQPMFLTC